jgi:hypothetical protein
MGSVVGHWRLGYESFHHLSCYEDKLIVKHDKMGEDVNLGTDTVRTSPRRASCHHFCRHSPYRCHIGSSSQIQRSSLDP